MKIKYIKRIVGISAVLVCCSYLYFMIHEKPSKDTYAKKTDVSISSDKLLTSFSTNETKANTDFAEKTIEVVGNIKKITHINNRYTVLLQGQSDTSHVICDVLPSSIEKVKKLKPGQTVRFKGICKGYLLDVIMLNCILIKG